jgi:hypothetical protein
MSITATGFLVGESPTLSDNISSDVHNAFSPFGVCLFSITVTATSTFISLVLMPSTWLDLCVWSLTCGGLLA